MNGVLHSGILSIHIAGGAVALLAGAVAAAARKGDAIHGFAGTWFFGSMLVLGVTAAILEPFRQVPGSPVGGIMVCYFVATSWMTARRRHGTTGIFEKIACAVALAMAAAMAWGAFTGATTPAGVGPVFALAAVCLVAGLLDLNAILRGKLTPVQRISRHLWRMCFAFFIATGSFFLGQQNVFPQALRGSPVLFILAFAPFALLLVGLVQVRFSNRSASAGCLLLGQPPLSSADPDQPAGPIKTPAQPRSTARLVRRR